MAFQFLQFVKIKSKIISAWLGSGEASSLVNFLTEINKQPGETAGTPRAMTAGGNGKAEITGDLSNLFERNKGGKKSKNDPTFTMLNALNIISV